MSELGELVNATAFGNEEWECPFDHKEEPKHTAENVLPPVDGKDTNNAATLEKNLKAISETLENKPITVLTVSTEVQYTAHHVIPGNGSWKSECKLVKWVDEDKSHIVKDIGYDVNAASNGIHLPGIHGLGSSAWSGAGAGFQDAYAFVAMEASSPQRQFHDAHPAYNNFVFNVLEKIAQKLDEEKLDEMPGCGKENCGGGTKDPDGKWDPPYTLLGRLQALALRLKAYLTGDPSGWRKPLFTSRMALLYKMSKAGLSAAQADARAELKTDQFAY